MRWQQAIQKLRADGPLRVGQRVFYRRWRRVRQRGRRRRWQSPHMVITPEQLPLSIDTSAAERLWPGAADRSWVVEAPNRWPDCFAKATQLAEAAAEGRFDLLGTGPTSVTKDDGRIDWHRDFKSGASFPQDCLYLDVPTCLDIEGSDIKIPWELSRFQHIYSFIWVEPTRYGDVFLKQWRDWMTANPVARGVNWACTMEVALRAITWTTALAAWGKHWPEDDRREFFAALATHGRFIRDNLEWAPGARTNHYFADIVGLAVIGAVLTPLPEARSWSSFSARELRREIMQEFAEDGFNCECSTTYHRLMVELATLGWLASCRNEHALGDACRDRILASYRAIALLCNTSGEAPLIGDNDSSRVFPLAPRNDSNMACLLPLGATLFDADDLAVGEAPMELALLCGPEALKRYKPTTPRPAPAEGGLPDSGFFFLGDDSNRMVVRCGPLTYRPVGGHRHLDQLSLTVSLNGRMILVDPGQYCYTAWPARRNAYRGTRAHNTVEIDGEPQCRVHTQGRMMFSIVDEAQPRCQRFHNDSTGGEFVGSHRGYRRLAGGGNHQRRILFDAANPRWTITDTLDLTGRHHIAWYYHLHPEANVQMRDTAFCVSRDGGALILRMLEPQTIRARLQEAVYAEGYGRETITQAIVFETESLGPVRTQLELCVVRNGQ